MINTILPQEMKTLEQSWMHEHQIPSILLMDRAARAVVSRLQAHVPSSSPVLFLCGPGANGGDGYATARLWQEQGGTSMILELSSDAQGDAGVYRRLCLADDIPIFPWDASNPIWFKDFPVMAVDALFGTGLSRPLSPKVMDLLLYVQALRVPVLAVDIPSGLDGGTGHVLGYALHCIETVTFHRPKPGLFLASGPSYTGKVTVAPIMIPQEYGSQNGFSCLSPHDLPALFPPRDACAHKGTFGHVFIFAGSPGMAGAAAMCAQGAVKAGAGLVTILCRQSLLPILQTLVPSAMCIPLPEEDGILTDKCCEIVEAGLQKATVAVVGCGLGQTDDLIPILSIFRSAACPVIWDADALNLLVSHPSLLPLPPKDVVTPHPGEAGRLLGIPAAKVLQDAPGALETLHKVTGCQVVLKTSRTLMYAEGQRAIQTVSSPSLARGGSGDLLCGILAGTHAILSQQPSILWLQCAVMIHALAGIRAAKKSGEHTVSPQEFLSYISVDGTIPASE
ncbi:MAG: NAD(P)H-hydrate dehydratase [Clostridia bacterium]|nr:NAD(P)H-hydrate dehydratase [Clostridia bacterium]